MKRHIHTLLFLAVSIATPASNFATWSAKANRFFANSEWASAGAMYSLMLEQRPDSAAVWGHAIVAAGMLGQTEHQLGLLHSAINSGVPLDSIFNATRTVSFSIMQTDLYENFLLAAKKHEPWMERVINLRLLDYYSFRDNGPGMVQLSNTMLEGLPDDRRFLYSLARGQMLCGDMDNAMATYSKIARLYPQSTDALLYLGNWYASKPDREAEAAGFLQRAYTLQPTPYLKDKINGLTNTRQH